MPAGDVSQTPPAGDLYTAVPDRRRRQRLAQLGYRTQVVQQPDGQFYWHAWLREDRVNGGLSETREKAEERAHWAVLQHSGQHYPRL